MPSSIIMALRRPGASHLALLMSAAISIPFVIESAGHSARDASSMHQSLDEQVLDDSSSIKPEDVWIDAFNMSLCGRAKFRLWQEQESAFNCPSNWSRVGHEAISSQQQILGQSVAPRIMGGYEALEGEFPSHVHIRPASWTGNGHCGATLIDNSLLVTAAHCVQQTVAITLNFGSNWINGTGGEERKAIKWCHSDRFFNLREAMQFYDLAIIQMDKPIEYKRDKIWPACVKLDARHSGSSTCAVAGFGRTVENELSNFLKALPVKRVDRAVFVEQSTYINEQHEETNPQNVARGDSGSPIICYDRCTEDSQTRAYATAAISWGSDNYANAADFNLLQSDFLKLIKAIRLANDENMPGTICKLAYWQN